MMENKKDDIKSEIRRFITTYYLRGAQRKQLRDDDSFLTKGILDSIGVIEVTSFIQSKYGIRIEVSEITPENFDTVNNLEKYIAGKLKKKA